MKKLLALLLIGAILCAFPIAANTEDAEDVSQFFHIAYAMYDGYELFGEVEIPDGTWFVRASFFLPGNQFFVLIIPISREGLFQLHIAVNCEHIAIGIVDSPAAMVPGKGAVFKTAIVSFI